MKVLITDTENNIGKHISNYLSKNNIIYGFNKDSLYLPDKTKTLELIFDIKPDIVIHTSSMDNLELCEEDESMAYTLNTIGSLNTAYPCSLLDIPILYFSTSYVYEGTKNSPYYETDECSPLNIYGKTKLASEKLIRTLCKKFFILRTSWIYGGMDCFVKNVLQNKDANIFMSTNEIGNPTYILDLCAAVEKIMCSNLYGIYNCAPSSFISKAEWVRYIFQLSAIKKEVFILPDEIMRGKALRPLNAALNTKLIANCFDIQFPDWQNSLQKYLKLTK